MSKSITYKIGDRVWYSDKAGSGTVVFVIQGKRYGVEQDSDGKTQIYSARELVSVYAT